jgi:hypothetical protein
MASDIEYHGQQLVNISYLVWKELHDLLEELSSFKTSSLQRKTIEELKKQKIARSKSEIEEQIYHLMTQRLTREALTELYQKHYAGKEKGYFSKLGKTKYSNGSANPSRGWYGVLWHEPGTRIQTVIGRVLRTNKEYFTLFFDWENHIFNYNNIMLLVEMLPDLQRELEKLSKKYNARIQFKIPLELKRMLNHEDSLVVHHSNRKLTRLIKETVMRVAKKHRVIFDSRNQMRSGDGADITVPGVINTSHSGAIAELLSEELVDSILNGGNLPGAELNSSGKFNGNVFGEYLAQRIREIGHEKPSEFLGRFS